MIVKNNAVDPYKLVSVDSVEKNNRSGNTTQNIQNKMVNDKISLSGDAKLHTQAYTAAMNSSDIRSDRVNSLKEQVNSGNYTPNSMKTAKAMVSDILSNKVLYS